MPGVCSGPRDRNQPTRPGAPSSWGDSQAYHAEKVQGVLWGRKYQGPGSMEQVCLTHSGRKFQKGFLEETTFKPRHYALFKQARFLLAPLEAHHAGDTLRSKSTKILKSFFICLSPPCAILVKADSFDSWFFCPTFSYPSPWSHSKTIKLVFEVVNRSWRKVKSSVPGDSGDISPLMGTVAVTDTQPSMHPPPITPGAFKLFSLVEVLYQTKWKRFPKHKQITQELL